VAHSGRLDFELTDVKGELNLKFYEGLNLIFNIDRARFPKVPCWLGPLERAL
jgi:hypothetical protein